MACPAPDPELLVNTRARGYGMNKANLDEVTLHEPSMPYRR